MCVPIRMIISIYHPTPAVSAKRGFIGYSWRSLRRKRMYNDWSSRQSACESPPEMCIHHTCIHQLLFVLALEDKFLGEIKPGLVRSLFLGGHFGAKPQRLVYRMFGSVKTQANTKRGATTKQGLGGYWSGQEKLSHTAVDSRCPEWSQEPAF